MCEAGWKCNGRGAHRLWFGRPSRILSVPQQDPPPHNFQEEDTVLLMNEFADMSTTEFEAYAAKLFEACIARHGGRRLAMATLDMEGPCWKKVHAGSRAMLRAGVSACGARIQ